MVLIRGLKWTDMNQLVDNYYSYYDEVRNESPELGLVFYHSKPAFEYEVEWFSNIFKVVLSGDVIGMVAEEDGKVIGFCDVHRVMPGYEVSHIGSLGIAIRKEYRGKGIGKMLMKKTIEQCKGNFEMLILGVFAGNQKAISLYEDMGFTEYGILHNAIKRGDKYFDEKRMYLML